MYKYSSSYCPSESDSGRFSISKASSIESSISSGQCNDTIPIQIAIVDLNEEVILQLPMETTIFDIKKALIASFGKRLHDPVNYGLYMPPFEGKVGKFLQEERVLKEYPLQGSFALLEFIYKRRLFSCTAACPNANTQRKLNSKSNIQNFLDYVGKGDVAKCCKYLDRGMDPNFHCPKTGETPLTLAAARLTNPYAVITCLVNGGAHIDYRAKDGMTPLHKAALTGNCESVTTLLNFGQSPNCLDRDNLSPLYLNILHDGRTSCAERLLYDHSIVGVMDSGGMQEIHQACRLGRPDHLAILLRYGVDVNVRTRSGTGSRRGAEGGDTPLHVAAEHGQEACVRILLARGANRDLVNRSGNTPAREARLAGHKHLVELIKEFSIGSGGERSVDPVEQFPQYNQKRRPPALPLLRNAASIGGFLDQLDNASNSGASSQISDAVRSKCRSEGGGSRLRSAYDPSPHRPHRRTKTNKLAGNGSGAAPLQKTASLGDLTRLDAVSDTIKAKGSRKRADPKRPVGVSGGYPISGPSADADAEGDDSTLVRKGKCQTMIRYWSKMSLNSLLSTPQDEESGTVPRCPGNANPVVINTPRLVVLQRSPEFGYGISLRRTKRTPPGQQFLPSLREPSLQRVSAVDARGPAAWVGIRPGDYILEVNGTNVMSASSLTVSAMLEQALRAVTLKVVTTDPNSSSGTNREDRSTLFLQTAPGGRDSGYAARDTDSVLSSASSSQQSSAYLPQSPALSDPDPPGVQYRRAEESGLPRSATNNELSSSSYWSRATASSGYWRQSSIDESRSSSIYDPNLSRESCYRDNQPQSPGWPLPPSPLNPAASAASLTTLVHHPLHPTGSTTEKMDNQTRENAPQTKSTEKQQPSWPFQPLQSRKASVEQNLNQYIKSVIAKPVNPFPPSSPPKSKSKPPPIPPRSTSKTVAACRPRFLPMPGRLEQNRRSAEEPDVILPPPQFCH